MALHRTSAYSVAAAIDSAAVAQVTNVKKQSEHRFHQLLQPEFMADPQRAGSDPRASVEALEQAGINSVFYASPDTALDWHTWRWSLHEFTPLLFPEMTQLRLRVLVWLSMISLKGTDVQLGKIALRNAQLRL